MRTPVVNLSHFTLKLNIDGALGRELENLHKYGIEQLFAELSYEFCTEQGFDQASAHIDTTSFSFQGQYETEEEDAAVEITYGYSKDHRPDLKQMVLEMAVSNEGIPLALLSPFVRFVPHQRLEPYAFPGAAIPMTVISSMSI